MSGLNGADFAVPVRTRWNRETKPEDFEELEKYRDLVRKRATVAAEDALAAIRRMQWFAGATAVLMLALAAAVFWEAWSS